LTRPRVARDIQFSSGYFEQLTS